MSKARHARARRSTRRVARTLSIAGLGAGITAAGAGAAFATDYQVKAGDTLSEIAQANGADWHELARINNLKDPNLILIGQTLTLDGAKTKQIATLLKALEARTKSLIVVETFDAGLATATRNIPDLKVMLAAHLNAYAVLNCDKLIITKGALEKLSSRWN